MHRDGSLQRAVAQCLEGRLQQVYEGTAERTEKEANMLAVMSAVEVSPERISDDDAMELRDMLFRYDLWFPQRQHRSAASQIYNRSSLPARQEKQT